jgi:hypothetical protein
MGTAWSDQRSGSHIFVVNSKKSAVMMTFMLVHFNSETDIKIMGGVGRREVVAHGKKRTKQSAEA